MGKLRLSYIGHLSDRVQDLYDGRVVAEGVDLDYLPALPVEGFRRMLAGEFDVGEMSFATYVVKVARGERDLVAIPVFPSRSFRHSAIYVSERSGIVSPADLAGRRVGVPEYQMTVALWVRGLLQHEHGIAPSDVEWVTGGLRDPGRRGLVEVDIPGVSITHEAERSLDELLRTGAIDAIIAPQDPPSFVAGDGVRRLFPDYRAAEAAYYRKTGLFPIMHTVVFRREVYEAHPWAAVSLYRAFEQAKANAFERLFSREPLPISLPWLQPEIDATLAIMGDDFWPYGIEPNRKVLEAACTYIREQGICDRSVDVDALFAPNVGPGSEGRL